MKSIIWICLAVVAGSVLPLQGGLNSKLGKAAESPYLAALISFSVGVISLLTYMIATKQTFSFSGLKEVPALGWTGGMLGACYVTIVILAFPKLGPGLTFGLIVAGQMFMSSILEHFNILVANPQPINIYKILGICLIIGGVVIMKKF